jgi:hypothetical protein
MTQVDIHEQLWHALPDRWVTHDEVRDLIRGVTVGATVTFKDEPDDMLDFWICGLVDQEYVTWRSEYKTEPMSASAWQKLQNAMGVRTNMPPERRYVVFWYLRRRLDEVPIVESRRRAVQEVKDALKQVNDAEDAKVLAAVKRLGLTADSLTTTRQEASNG